MIEPASIVKRGEIREAIATLEKALEIETNLNKKLNPKATIEQLNKTIPKGSPPPKQPHHEGQ